MRFQFAILAAAALSLFNMATALAEDIAESKTLGVVTITGTRPTSLPTQIPTTMEGISQEQIARRINATDSEDALKYLPSLLVRKRYVGDYNHAVLSSRASGTGNSARSAVYADGILLSNYLGNGATYAPRWGMVTPEEIERVDVMYGPFSAAYPGNSAGAVVDYLTRMPEKLEAHAKATFDVEPYHLYNTDETFSAHQESTSVGDRNGNASWWLDFDHTDSHGQPLTFTTKLISTGTTGSAGTPVAGPVLDADRSFNPWFILGTDTEYRTIQDHAKFKLAYELTPTLRASYLLGWWQNDSTGRPLSFLRDGAGNTIYTGTINVAGRSFTLAPTDFNLTNEALQHFMHGLSLKSSTGGAWDWELAASLFDYQRDELRTATIGVPAALSGGAGTLTDQRGTGWNTLALKGTWRPTLGGSRHIVDLGYQQDHYQLRILKTNLTGNWITDGAGSLSSDVGGAAGTRAIYVQDSWNLAPRWQTVLGARYERWHADNGFTRTSSSGVNYASRSNNFVSPKAALAWQIDGDSVLKASVGRAVRMPTVNELYGATSGVLTVINDPNLQPEKSWTGELSWTRERAGVRLRATGFYEAVRDSLYSERTAVGSTLVTRIVNVGRIVTPGVELALDTIDRLVDGLSLSASLTWADSRIRENAGYATVPGDTIGKYQPRVPEWRATLLASYRLGEHWNATLGSRYSGTQFSTLDNSDPNGYAYQGASPYFTMDARLHYQSAGHWSAAFGLENLNNDFYWNFHPYPQRTFSAELRYDL